MATSARPTEESPIEKWEIQLRKGCLELAILGCLWSGKLYGLEVLRLLEARSDLVLSASTLYPLLSRLKADGLLQSEWVEAEEGGHPRKYYRLTPAGRRLAVEMASVWSKLSATVEELLSPVLKERSR